MKVCNDYKKGPFKTTITSVRDCAKTSRPRLKPEYGPVDTYWAELYNTTKKINLLRANISLNEHNTKISLKINIYLWKDNKWKEHIFMPDIDCDSPFMTFLGKMTNLKYDTKTCSIPKGVYWMSSMDFDKLDHFYSSERVYGRELRKIELITKYNTLICALVETLVEPAKK